MIICAMRKIKFVIDNQLGTPISFLLNIVTNNKIFTIKLSGNAMINPKMMI